MRVIVLVAVCAFSIANVGCEKSRNVVEKPEADACSLLLPEEVAQIIGALITEHKSSARNDGVFRITQCFYTATEPLNSVALAVTRSRAGGPALKEFWERTFGDAGGGEQEREREGEEEGRRNPPRKIDGIGDKAFWTNGQLLYVLKGEIFLRISVGGNDAEEKKIEKSKTLAKRALGRM